MGGDIGKTGNLLLTAVMLVVVLIACQKTPESTIEPENSDIQPSYQPILNLKYR